MEPIALPTRLADIFEPSRYKVMYGGRGGGKSWSVARALLVIALSRKTRVLCTREYQVSIQDSVHRVLKDQISELGFDAYFSIQKNGIFCVNGSEFLFKGVGNDPDQIKSTEGVDICWVEEAQSVSNASWEVLIPTIRKEGSEIWVTFNPRHASDPTYQRFLTAPPPGTWCVKIGWEDNPWFPKTLAQEKDHAYAVDPEGAEHIWGGKTRTRSDADVLNGKWSVSQFEIGENWNGPYQGVDWGFASSATAGVRVWIDGDGLERTLYVSDEVYGVGIENDELPDFFGRIDRFSEYVTRADSARPEQVSHMRRHGYPKFKSAEKWPGSVHDGVAHLRGYKKIVIHPRCRHAIDEAGLWRYKIDKLTGDILPDLVSANDHVWDAVRYALSPVIRGGLKKHAVPSILGTSTNRRSPV